MSKYAEMKLSDLKKEDRGLYGNLLLAKLEAQQILHEEQDYKDDNGNLVEPKVTKYFEKEVELTIDAFLNFLTNDDLNWTVAELKASVEIEEIKTFAPLAVKSESVVKATGVGNQGAPVNSNGSANGMLTEPLSMRKDGAKHGGRLRATGHAYVGEKDIVPNSDTNITENNFTKVKLFYDKIPKDLLK
tara:strand:+ start:315 stop:878 length:564 start_codon:yes stop_codon:yes gene_type:complete